MHGTKEGNLFSLQLDKNKGFSYICFCIAMVFKLTVNDMGLNCTGSHIGRFFG